MSFCQTLLLSDAQQQNVTEDWLEDSASVAIPSPSTSDVMGQHNKTGITFMAALIYSEQLHIYIWIINYCFLKTLLYFE